MVFHTQSEPVQSLYRDDKKHNKNKTFWGG